MKGKHLALLDAQNERLYLAAKERDILIVRARRWKAFAKHAYESWAFWRGLEKTNGERYDEGYEYGWDAGYDKGAAVAFGLMGMAEAIRARAPLEHLSEVYRQTSLVAARAEACWDYAEPDLDDDGALVPNEVWEELVESIRELHFLQRKTK